MIPTGARIAVIAPSGVYRPELLEAGLERLRAEGYRPHPFPGMLQPERYLAAPDALRLSHLVGALIDPAYDAVWIARGGYGITRLLDRIPWESIVPKPVIGFSDVTALLVALHQRVGCPALHAPMPHSIPATDEPSLNHLFSLLRGEAPAPLLGETWVEGEARGPLVGGNLAMLAALCGTPDQLDATDAIVVLEDIGEAPYRLDRMLQQLASAGVMKQATGFALGQFTACNPPDGASWTLREVLLDHLGHRPVVAALPIGHGPENWAFPYGVRASLANGRLSWGR